MSTRAQITVEGTDIWIYKHCDGYPDDCGVLPTLEPFCKWFLENRGWDPEYLLAQIVREFARADMIEEQSAEGEPIPGFNARRCESHRTLGWGLGHDLHGDIEYLYIVKKDCIEVRETLGRFWDDPSIEKNTTVERIVKLDA